MQKPFDPYGGEIPTLQPNGPNLGGASHEIYGGRVEEQHEAMQRALNYSGRFSPPQPGPGTTHGDGRTGGEGE